MSKKALVTILLLSVVVTYIASFIDSSVSHTFLAGAAGFPFKYSSASLFGTGSINYPFMVLDIVFWFLIIWGVWKLLKIFLKR